MTVARWILDWVAPVLIIAFGVVYFLNWAYVLRDEPKSLAALEEPWWITVLICGTCILLGVLRLRMTLRRRRLGL